MKLETKGKILLLVILLLACSAVQLTYMRGNCDQELKYSCVSVGQWCIILFMVRMFVIILVILNIIWLI